MYGAMLSDLGGEAVIVLFASAVAVMWPWLASRQRRAKFQALIRRELEEAGPHPLESTDQPWWEHQTKRFVHEEIFARQNVSDNRDFILSLPPTVTYHVSQLWIAFDKRDHDQWQYHMQELSTDPHVRSKKLRLAYLNWRLLLTSMKDEHKGTPYSRASRQQIKTELERTPDLFTARLDAYGPLLKLTRVPENGRPAGPDGEPVTSDDLRNWYYEAGNGLLLSGDALVAFSRARECLEDSSASEKDLQAAMSTLRTEMKIDLGVRHPDERHVEFARPKDRHTH